jgi:hypothetical protein
MHTEGTTICNQSGEGTRDGSCSIEHTNSRRELISLVESREIINLLDSE